MIKAKKHFGQNFLKDQSVLYKIIQAIPKNYNLDVIEIGAGLGDLTFWLLNSGCNVLSYEIDTELIPILNDKFNKEAREGRFKLINEDVNLNWHNSLYDREYILVANLPYYVATKIILNALQDDFCKCIIVMVQKEVALKFAFCNNSLGILSSLNSESRLLFDVNKECFDPEPKITSSVLKISKIASLYDGFFKDLNDYNDFKSFLKICFLSPRKTLLKNLSSKVEVEFLKNIFNKLDLDIKVRPHQSNTALYLKIYNEIKVKNERKQSR